MNSVLETILAMNKDEFHALVNDDIRGKAPDHMSQALRDPEVVERWYNALVSIKRNMETQLANDRFKRIEKKLELMKLGNAGQMLWLEFVREREEWKAGAIRFKNGVEDKISEAKIILRNSVNIERDILIRRLAELRLEVKEHMESFKDDEADERDIKLWTAAGVLS